MGLVNWLTGSVAGGAVTGADAGSSGGLEFDDVPGWIWTVYPVDSADPMVSLGHAGNQARAREHVEGVLARAGAWGVVIGPRGEHLLCRRNGSGGFAWRPMFGTGD